MSKKPHPLEGLSTILGTLKGEAQPPSPAPVQPLPRPAAEPDVMASKGGKGRPATGKKGLTGSYFAAASRARRSATWRS